MGVQQESKHMKNRRFHEHNKVMENHIYLPSQLQESPNHIGDHLILLLKWNVRLGFGALCELFS